MDQSPREGDEASGEIVPGQPRGPMMRGMTRPPEGSGPSAPEHPRPSGMPFMWGQRWGGLRGDPAQLFPSLPKAAKIRQFWEGSAFGVAVPAQSFPGVIAVHADADGTRQRLQGALREHVAILEGDPLAGASEGRLMASEA